MQYIIFGAGRTGQKAAMDLGLERVGFFAVNNLPLNDKDKIFNIRVISFEEMVTSSESGDYIIVLASERYAIEMDSQLRVAGITKYFIYHEFDPAELWKLYPSYYLHRAVNTLSYTKVLSLYHIDSYSRIAIYGENFYLPYLICEIAIQNSYNNIVGVISENKTLGGNRLVGLKNCTLDEVWDDIDCLILNVKFSESDIRSRLDVSDCDFEVVDIYDIDKFEPEYHHKQLIKYKDLYRGKRVFVIGNGPSLLIEDLDKLNTNGEICFGANSIYKIFEKTTWRPNYLCFIDPVMIGSSRKEIEAFYGDVFIADIYHRYGVDFPDGSNIQVVHQAADVTDLYFPNKPGFSADITNGVSTSFTVTYFCIQIAAYMGASEIYLIGVDNTIGTKCHATKHFTSDYMTEAKKEELYNRVKDEDMSRNIEMINKGFMKAEEYSRTHGFRIFNATRGGMLEVFERVDFDSLFVK